MALSYFSDVLEDTGRAVESYAFAGAEKLTAVTLDEAPEGSMNTASTSAELYPLK